MENLENTRSYQASEDPRLIEQEFLKKIISDYLAYGSVDKVFEANGYELPISYPGFHHLLNRWGIVKAAGPNTKWSEVLAFFNRMVIEKLPLESLYRKMPPSFSTSVSTLHRVLRHVKSGLVRRAGTALVICPEGRDDVFLVGSDVAVPRLEYGKAYGAVTPPMGFSKRGEDARVRILRLLQQEVYAHDAVERRMPEIKLEEASKLASVDVCDTRVDVYRLELPVQLCGLDRFSSRKLTNFQFVGLADLEELEGRSMLRAGVLEFAREMKSLEMNRLDAPVVSRLNQELLALQL